MIYRNWATDAEVAKFVIWRPHASIEDTRAFLASAYDGWDRATEFTWLMRLRSDHSFARYRPRANGTKPSAFGMRTFASAWASIVSVSPMMPLSSNR